MDIFNPVNCTGVPAPTELSILTACIFAILCFITTISNMLVLIAVVYDPLKILKTPFSIILANLAMTDLFVGAITDPLLLATHILEARNETQPPADVRLMMYFLPSTASVFSLVALTLDRCFAVSSPFNYQTKMSRNRAGVLSGIVWVAAAGLCSSYFFTGFIIYHFIFINVAVISAVILYIVLHFIIQKILKDQRTQETGNDERLRMFVARQEKTSRTVLNMMGLFLLCYGPSAILIYTMNLCSTCSCYDIHWMRDWSAITIMVNSGIDPFLYTFRLPQYKKTVLKILGNRKHRLIHPQQIYSDHNSDQPQSMDGETIQLSETQIMDLDVNITKTA